MKRFWLCLALVLGLAQFSNLLAQEALVELDSITNAPMQIASTPGVVQAMSVYIANSSYVPYYLIDYSSSQTWYMVITVLNTSAVNQSFKVDFDLRYADGASYYVYRAAYTIAAGTMGTTRVNVSSYVAKMGLLTLTGRVYGKGMGNNNRVTSQVFVF